MTGATIVDPELLTIMEHMSSTRFQLGSCCLLIGYLCGILWTIVCLLTKPKKQTKKQKTNTKPKFRKDKIKWRNLQIVHAEFPIDKNIKIHRIDINKNSRTFVKLYRFRHLERYYVNWLLKDATIITLMRSKIDLI